MDTYGAIGCANQGEFGANGNGDVGVFVAGVIVIENFADLLEQDIINYSSFMSESRMAAIKEARKKNGTSHLAKFIDPCPQKLKILGKKANIR